MRREIIFKSDNVQLERIHVKIGDCRMIKYREVSLIKGELEVKETKEFPEWYIRELKLQILLDGIQD